MRARTGLRKAVVGGGAVIVVVVVGLLVKTDIGVPFLPGRPPETSYPGPVGFSTGGPTAEADWPDARLSQVYVETVDLSALLTPPDSTTATDLPAPVDGGELRSEPDGPIRDTEGILASVLLGLIVLRASRARNDRDRRRPTADLAAAA